MVDDKSFVLTLTEKKYFDVFRLKGKLIRDYLDQIKATLPPLRGTKQNKFFFIKMVIFLLHKF